MRAFEHGFARGKSWHTGGGKAPLHDAGDIGYTVKTVLLTWSVSVSHSMRSKRDIVFIFGAGASYGAGDILPERPPLGGELYGALSKHFGSSWGALSPEIAARFEEDFEKGMGLLYEDFSPSIPALMRELAIFLIQLRPATGSSAYCRLVEKLQDASLLDRVVFSTLNYDCILEFSLAGRGIGVNYFEVNDSESSVPVLKLHGSCNMFAKNVAASGGVRYSAGASFEGGIEASLDIGTVVEKCLVSGLAPAMCLYMEGKPLQISPSVIEEVQTSWRECIASADHIVCIGLRPHPPDNHIWDPIASATGMLSFVGEEEAFDEWNSNYRTGESAWLGPYFHGGLEPTIRRLLDDESK